MPLKFPNKINIFQKVSARILVQIWDSVSRNRKGTESGLTLPKIDCLQMPGQQYKAQDLTSGLISNTLSSMIFINGQF